MLNRNAIAEQVRKRVQIDTRSLAVFRVIAGILIIVDIILRLRSFRFFYTDQGVLPVAVATEIVPTNAFSFFLLSGDPTFTLFLFVIHFLIAIQLILGYYTRVAIVLSFLFVVSLDYRNPLVTSYADLTFRHLLFWGMFMPLGARYSIDSIRSNNPAPEHYTGLAGMFALLQMIFMYLANGSHKIPFREDWLNGNSMTGILHYDSISILLGNYLREFPLFMQFSGIMWYSLMLGAPLLLLFVGRERYLLASIYACGHLFLAVTVRIGAFPFAAIMGLTLFAQSRAWADGNRVATWLNFPIEHYYNTITQLGKTIDHWLPEFSIQTTIFQHSTLRSTVYVSVALIVLIAGIFMVIPNLQTIGVMDDEQSAPYQAEVEGVQHAFRLVEPPWRFYQGPVTYDEYYVFAGKTAAGTHVDVYNDRPLQWDRPHGVHNHKQLDTYRHRFYMYAIMNRGDDGRDDGVIESYADYLCTNWEWEGESLEHLNMYYIRERASMETVHDYTQYNRSAVLIDAYHCGGDEPELVELPPSEYRDRLDPDLYELIQATEDVDREIELELGHHE